MTFSDFFKKWGLEKIKINAKFAEMEFKLVEDDQIAAWEMYVELLTRITTQSLDDEVGDEETALTSIYNLFDITRDILKTKGRNATQFTKVAIIVMNQIIRPFTAKWHKKKIDGAFSDWGECYTFRTELKELQDNLISYTRLLAEMADVEDLTVINSID